MRMNTTNEVQHVVAEILAADPWFAEHGVEIIQQNKADLKFLLDRRIGSLKGVALVIGCDAIRNMHPELEVTLTCTAVEYVPLNRASGNNNFATAIDAVQACVDALDGAWWHFDDISHDTPADKVLQATATFRGNVVRYPSPESEGGDNTGGN